MTYYLAMIINEVMIHALKLNELNSNTNELKTNIGSNSSGTWKFYKCKVSKKSFKSQFIIKLHLHQSTKKYKIYRKNRLVFHSGWREVKNEKMIAFKNILLRTLKIFTYARLKNVILAEL